MPGRYPAAGPTRPTPPPRNGAWLTVAILVALALVGGLVAWSIVSDDDEDAKKKRDNATTTTLAPTARVTDRSELTRYCDSPGTAWPEVPRHVAGEPDRTWIDPPTSNPATVAVFGASGGSTVISPKADGKITTDESVLERTRTIACIEHDRLENTGTVCTDYVGGYGRSSYDLARSYFTVTVYELHSGGILHKGEIITELPSCPENIRVGATDTQLTTPLTDRLILDWMTSHFVDGKPN